tara:strand:- start:4 stop:1059 length:1056 start_codon:yes stop_codon:yes gene_type:complete
MPGASIILLQTRWHDDDLAGRLLQKQEEGGDKWEIIDLPALADGGPDLLDRKKGEALWPEWFNEETLNQIKSTVGTREWSALYQQKPMEEDGAYFKLDWFTERYDHIEINNKLRAELSAIALQEGSSNRKSQYFSIYGASDFAVTNDAGDYSVHMVIGIDPEDNIYVLDLWRDRTEPDVWISSMADLILKWKPIQWGCAKGQIQRSVGPFMKKELHARKAYTDVVEYAEINQKDVRARSIQARASMGKVLLPQSAPWLDAFLYELTRFPAGKNDDQVDTLSMFGVMLDDLRPGRELKPLENMKVDLNPSTFKDAISLHRKRKKWGSGQRESIVVTPNSIDWDLMAQKGKLG